jgi:hypothetical protein
MAMQPALWGVEYLGWNAKWVSGFRGTNDVMIAFDRGEIDMTSTGNIFEIQDRLRTGHLKIVNQSGIFENGKFVARDEFGGAPLFSEQMQGKIKDPVAQKAFDYWAALASSDKWFGLAPGTSADIVEAYRDAFRKSGADKELLELSERISDGFIPMVPADVQNVVRILADTPPEASDYVRGLMRKQGL